MGLSTWWVAVIMLLFAVPAYAQENSQTPVALKDSNGIKNIENEFRLHLVRSAGDRRLVFHIEQAEERNLDIKMTDLEYNALDITPDKKKDVWVLDLSELPNGKYLLLIYDYDANRLAHLMVHKQRIRTRRRN